MQNKALPSPIVFYYPTILSNAGDFCKLLEKRFRETGHNRPIVFKPWDCYAEAPGRDGDLFAYDGVVLSTLVNRGLLHQLPDVVDVSDVFEWIHSCSRVHGQLYGIPFMVCGSFLISQNNGTSQGTSINVHNLKGGITTLLLREIIPYLNIMAFCHDQGREGRYLENVQYLENLIKTGYADSEEALRANIECFMRGDCRYVLSFSEDLRYLQRGDYNILLINFSDRETNDLPLFFCDYISIGTDVSDEKLLDCLDLMEIVVDNSFLFDVCTADGHLQYMLPAVKSVYARLAEWDPIYNKMHALVSDPNNCVMRYAKDFYADFHADWEN